ncbi:hypothetical protein L1987_03474 [Smallanthus sonchifolius]|uniref:Uncharacterized protein n=1 Tax=Smallanthus sonchifolius TaxID=185202 RepID=A0ACB9KAT3_9ASTR|nr:hypothetical protein L1987_03474 [Smallanthus sonchifolius]
MAAMAVQYGGGGGCESDDSDGVVTGLGVGYDYGPYWQSERNDLYKKFAEKLLQSGQALGCLLFCTCYFKSAFDGESKLQVLNGNYRIPELPKPDIMHARALLDWTFISMNLGVPKSENKTSPMPRRSPPSPPSGAESARTAPQSVGFQDCTTLFKLLPLHVREMRKFRSWRMPEYRCAFNSTKG